MFGYNKEELLNFITEELEGNYVEDIQSMQTNNILGQGISRTTFYYPEYPDIVFKIGIGEEEICSNGAFDHEEIVYQKACQHNVDKYFATLENIGTLTLPTTEEGQEDYCYPVEMTYNIYIQPKADSVVGKIYDIFTDDRALRKEHHIINCKPEATKISSSKEVIALFIRKHSFKECQRLATFFREVSYLEDLHSYNWALKDDQMTIIDYAM